MDTEEQELANLFKDKKKKKKEKEKKEETSVKDNIYEDEDKDDMTYEEMLSRCYNHMEETQEAKRLRLALPKIIQIGSKRTGWTNFTQTASLLQREISHMCSFIEAELGTTLSQTKDGALVLKGRFRALQIETILRKYIDKFVKCRTCKSNDTILERNQLTRLTSCKCRICYSEWTVETISKALPSVGKHHKAD